MKLLLTTLLFCMTAFHASSAFSETAEEKGLAIAIEAKLRDKGFIDYTADMEMILRNRQGNESRRSIRIKTLEVADDGDKSLSIFDTPKDVKGTAFLSFSHTVGDDDQWLYLPALKRVKRINSRNKSGSFMGSEFAYEDIASQEVEKYAYKHLRAEQYQGQDCFVGESYPVDKNNSGYTKRITWTDKEEYRVLKVEYYDRKQSLLKTLTTGGHQQYLGKYWRPAMMQMINHQTGKSTTLLWKNYQFRTGLTDNDFNSTSLKRAR
ncbi:MAG: outer membrane lipoprotein-sorting protein [Proteobacteria bacterium]|nr:outer membrane lipoprotein-sorting protein [Pseudomonadota bacterium]MBU1058688.1 outer membrane lipoprotein-sorting protein [Pseudomonadota bacterium]